LLHRTPQAVAFFAKIRKKIATTYSAGEQGVSFKEMSMDILTLYKVAAPAYNIIKSKFTNYKVEKVLIELANGKRDIKEICNNNSEIFRFTTLIDSLNKASTYAKANVLKDLYLSFDGENKSDEVDDLFFEVFSILGELSDREMHLLYLLERYHLKDIKNKRGNALYSKFFEKITDEGFGIGGDVSDSFYYFVSDKMGIEPDNISGLMKRLERSGLIESTGYNGNAKYQEYAHTALYRGIKTRLIVAMESSYGDNGTLTSDDI
jgi:hypothetical protein